MNCSCGVTIATVPLLSARCLCLTTSDSGAIELNPLIYNRHHNIEQWLNLFLSPKSQTLRSTLHKEKESVLKKTIFLNHFDIV